MKTLQFFKSFFKTRRKTPHLTVHLKSKRVRPKTYIEDGEASMFI